MDEMNDREDLLALAGSYLSGSEAVTSVVDLYLALKETSPSFTGAHTWARHPHYR